MLKPTIYEYANLALDAEYQRILAKMFAKIEALTTLPSSPMQRALANLEQETQGLMAEDAPIQSTSPALSEALKRYGSVFSVVASLILEIASEVQSSGQQIAVSSVTARVFRDATRRIISQDISPFTPKGQTLMNKFIGQSGAQWVRPRNPLDFATGYVDSAAWIDRMNKWGEGYPAMTRRFILDGIAKGQSPRVIADTLRQHAENIPYSAAENLTRTLQLNSYRDASLAMEELNGKFITGKIRIATLDERTCLSCIALHGTKLEPGERVDDHYRGRCTEYYQVPGGEEFPSSMQADSTPGHRNFVPFQKGEDWFKSLPPERQARQASFMSTPAKLSAYRDGTPLSAFVGEHQDSVFGHQFIENSLTKIGGEQYYMSPKTPSPSNGGINFDVDTSQLPLSKGANWSDLRDQDYRDFLLRRASKGIDPGEIVPHLDVLNEYATNPAYRLSSPETVYFGIDSADLKGLGVGDVFQSLGTRSTAYDIDRALQYAGSGVVFKVEVPAGSVAIHAKVLDVRELMLLPNSTFRVTEILDDGTKVIKLIDLTDDGSEYVRGLFQFQEQLNLRLIEATK